MIGPAGESNHQTNHSVSPRWVVGLFLFVSGVLLGVFGAQFFTVAPAGSAAVSGVANQEPPSSDRLTRTNDSPARLPEGLKNQLGASNDDYETIDVDQWMDAAAELPAGQQFRMLLERLPNLSNNDLRAVIERIGTDPDFVDAVEIIPAAGARLFAEEPQATMEWIRDTFGQEGYLDVMVVMMDHVTPRNGSDWWRMIQTVWPPQDAELLVGPLIEKIAELDPSRAFEIGQALFPDENTRLEAIATALQRWSESDPRAALNAVMTLPGDRFHSLFTATALNGWLAEDPDGMIQALESKSIDPRLRKQGVALAVHALAPGGIAETAAWLSKLDKEDVTGEAILNLTNHLTLEDPVAAIEWNSKIDEPALKARNQLDILSRWVISDALSAREYAVENPVNDPLIQQQIDMLFAPR